MGSDCRISLPRNVSLRTVSEVMGRLAGLPVVKQSLDFNGKSSDKPESYSARVDGIYIESINDSWGGMFQIIIPNFHYVYFHYEPDGRDDVVQMSPPSTPFWLAMGKALVDFFGGELDYYTGDQVTINYEKKFKSFLKNRPSNGDEWKDLQDRILNLQPLSIEDIRAMEEVAEYDLSQDKTKYLFDINGRLATPVVERVK